MTSDQLLTEIERQQKYLDRLPNDFNFPLFNAKTALESQRSSGYKDSASAAKEIVDNSIEANAKKIHVIFDKRQEKGKKRLVSSIAFIDNGSGMLPRMARYALTWGGGTHFDNPNFIGKFGFGLPNASINQTRLTEVFTKTSDSPRITKVVLDLDRFNDFGIQTIPEPEEVDHLPEFVEYYLKRQEWDFHHGTIVVWHNPDRLTYKTPENLKTHLIEEFAVSYRYLIHHTIDLFVENTRVDPIDPLFLEPSYRHFKPEEEGGAILVADVAIPIIYRFNSEEDDFELKKVINPYEKEIDTDSIHASSTIQVKVVRFPYGFIQGETKYKGTDEYKRFQIRKSRRGISFVRANREIETVDVFPKSEKDVAAGLGNWPLLQSYAYHWGVEIKFTPDLDAVFGVTNNKQSIRPTDNFWRILAREGIDDLLRRENAWQNKERKKPLQPTTSNANHPSPAETAAVGADNARDGNSPIPPDSRKNEAKDNLDKAAEKKAFEEGKSQEDARIELEQESKTFKYKIEYITNSYAPPWIPVWRGLQAVIQINRAHLFYEKVYGQLLLLPEHNIIKQGLDVLLIALSRAELTSEGEMRVWYETQRRDKWGNYLNTALSNLDLIFDALRGNDEDELQEYALEEEDNIGILLTQNERDYIIRTAVKLEDIFQNMGIQIHGYVDPKLTDVGASVLRFKIRLKSAEKITNLQSRSEDIQREISANKEPIIGTLPGTHFVFLDLPRMEPQPVLLMPYITNTRDKKYKENGLLCPFGITPSGEIIDYDLTALPHMLVAGATNSGKTIFLYSLIKSLTHFHKKENLELILIDPKQTDFVFFNQLPQLRNPVITDPQEAIQTLTDLLSNEVEQRTQLLTQTRTRDIQDYNSQDLMKKLPFIVVIIDEFADLADVMTKTEQEAFDLAMRRLAQRARSVGIHLVVATQRPSADIVRGAIKTNLPCRVSFRLATNVDSRTIIDQGGAEKLLGKGDMLVSWNGEVNRLQGFYVPEEDLRKEKV